MGLGPPHLHILIILQNLFTVQEICIIPFDLYFYSIKIDVRKNLCVHGQKVFFISWRACRHLQEHSDVQHKAKG